MRSPKPAPDEDIHHRIVVGTAGRRKGTVNRAWLVVSDSGRSYHEEVGKYSIMRRTGLPGRDLRVLDPLLSYPSTILGRERAIVINLEHIKAIITATEVLVPNWKDPIVAPFVQDLQSRVFSSNGAPQQEVVSSSFIFQSLDPTLIVVGSKSRNLSWIYTNARMIRFGFVIVTSPVTYLILFCNNRWMTKSLNYNY